MNKSVYRSLLRVNGLLLLVCLLIGTLHALLTSQITSGYMVSLTYYLLIASLLSSWLFFLQRRSFPLWTLLFSFILIGIVAHVGAEVLLGTLNERPYILLSNKTILSVFITVFAGIYGWSLVRSASFPHQTPHAGGGHSTILDTIKIKVKNRILLIDINNIIYIEAEDKYANVHTHDKKYLKDASLSSLVSRLPDYFIRISRSYIINKKEISEVIKEPRGSYMFEMTNNATLKSGNTYSKVLKETFEYGL